MRRILVGFCFVFIALAAVAQEQMYEDDTPILRRKEASLGLTIHTAGIGVNFRRGVHVTGKIKRMTELEFSTIRHPKEYRLKPYEESTPYVYGKLNSFTNLRAGLGMQHIMYRKGDRTGIEIRFHYMVGFSLGIAKPVYVYSSDATGARDSLPRRYDPNVQKSSNEIYGKAEFSYGLNEIHFYTGGYAKSAFSFEFGRSDRSLRSIETGVVFDLYPKRIPMMAFARNNPYFVNLYLAFFFGGKW